MSISKTSSGDDRDLANMRQPSPDGTAGGATQIKD
jgi:hypothetical protein